MAIPFFYFDNKKKAQVAGGYSHDLLHRLGCQVCPLKACHERLDHPDMQPYGSDRPLVYMLGEAPGREEDEQGIPFVGASGQVLRFRVPNEYADRLRWSNVVRTRPPENRTPTQVEIECCRPSIVADIERTKPKAIFGFGNVPLSWALKVSGVTKWNGRRIPVQIGKHRCWYFPMMHPAFVMRTRRFEPRTPNEYGSDIEFRFALDLEWAFDHVGIDEPVIHSVDDALDDISIVTGEHPDDADRIIEFLERAAHEKVVGFDLETNCKRPYTEGSKILSAAIATAERSLAFALFHSDARWRERDLDRVIETFTRFLYIAQCRKVVHHLAFEMEWLAYFFEPDVLRAGRWGDSLTQAYVLDERPGSHSLDFLVLQYFGLEFKAISNLDRKNLDKADVKAVLRYNALDAKYHRYVYLHQAGLIKDQGLSRTYARLLRRVPALVLTQLKGVPIDQQEVNKYFKIYSKRLAKIEADIQALPIARKFERHRKRHFRPSAPFDIRYALTEILGIQLEHGVTESVLSQIDHPIAKLNLAWRKCNKTLGTYIKPVRTGSPHLFFDSRIHPILNTIKTRTSRTSSEDPNSQNFPRRGSGKEVRSVVHHPDLKVVAFDYAGIQARNVAMESRDKALVNAFWDRYDIHGDWCERIAALYPRWTNGESLKDPDVRKNYRDIAKNKFVFPSFFGAQPLTVAGYLNVPDEIGHKLHAKFWTMFPNVHGWHKGVYEFYRSHGYVEGLSGVRRRAPISPNQIINSPIQADEALIVCTAMSALSELEDGRYQANMEIHDDLTFLWPKREIEKNAEVVIHEMLRINFDFINVPLGVEMKIGDDWANLKPAGEYFSDKLGLGPKRK